MVAELWILVLRSAARLVSAREKIRLAQTLLESAGHDIDEVLNALDKAVQHLARERGGEEEGEEGGWGGSEDQEHR